MPRLILLTVISALCLYQCSNSSDSQDSQAADLSQDTAVTDIVSNELSTGDLSMEEMPPASDIALEDNFMAELATEDVPPQDVAEPPQEGQYAVVDTNQTYCYDAQACIPCPAAGSEFHGQDGQYEGNQPQYQVSADGLTVYDKVTGLTWQQSPETDGVPGVTAADKLTWEEAQAYPAKLNAEKFGGFDDWRLPTIKEAYSLILFSGTDPSGYEGTDTTGLVPFMDDSAFEFAYGDTAAGERIIDSQYASSTVYVANTGGDGGTTLFGVNLADGRIKGYGLLGPDGKDKTFLVQCVRGNPDYGVNVLADNGDGTISDEATGLVWQKEDSGDGMLWANALAYCEELTLAGNDDWRLPDVKELQSIVDYARSPDTTNSPALDPLFDATQIVNEAGQDDWAFYWSSTTHVTWVAGQDGAGGAYVSFGRSLGYMNNSWVDVHGAGSQRSDPKVSDPADYPTGHGPQGDAIRIYNMVRCVTDGIATSVPGLQECPEAAEPECGDGMCTPGEEETCQQDCQQTPQGPTSCTTQADCEAPGACPPGASKGCLCSQTPQGKLCIPACDTDQDCPSPPGMNLVCGPEGTCLPGT